MRAREIPAVLTTLLLAAGCATAWAPRTSTPAVALSWPAAPAPAKLTYLRSLSGFGRPRRLGESLRAIAIGERRPTDDAFALPVAVAEGDDGRIAVADAGRGCVHLYLPQAKEYSRLTGSRRQPLTTPVGVAFDAESRLFVADSSGKLVAFDPAGDLLWVQTRAGSELLIRPTGLAFDRVSNRLYVVDTAAHRVDVFRGDGSFERSFGGRGSEPGRFNFPTQIASSPTGELVVADTLNFRVQIFDREGELLGAFGHHGDGSGDFALPKGVAVDRDGVIYVVDGRFDNVQLFDRQGRFLLTLGTRGGGFGQFWLPSGAFVSAAGELFVCDSYNRRVQVFRITERYAPDIS